LTLVAVGLALKYRLVIEKSLSTFPTTTEDAAQYAKSLQDPKQSKPEGVDVVLPRTVSMDREEECELDL
jgi:hypothetical protein